MSDRRDPGTLEAEVLGLLSRADAPVSPRELQVALGGELAYSTVTTVLRRLTRKGMVERARVGRRFCYVAIADQAAVVADRMHADLRRSGNRNGVLQRFLSELDDDEAASLRAMLDELDELDER